MELYCSILLLASGMGSEPLDGDKELKSFSRAYLERWGHSTLLQHSSRDTKYNHLGKGVPGISVMSFILRSVLQ